MQYIDIIGNFIKKGNYAVIIKTSEGLLAKPVSEKGQELWEMQEEPVIQRQQDEFYEYKKDVKDSQNIKNKYRDKLNEIDVIVKELKSLPEEEQNNRIKELIEEGLLSPDVVDYIDKLLTTSESTSFEDNIDYDDSKYRDDKGMMDEGTYEVQLAGETKLFKDTPEIIKIYDTSYGPDSTEKRFYGNDLAKLKIFIKSGIEYAYESDMFGRQEVIESLIKNNLDNFKSGVRTRDYTNVPILESVKQVLDSKNSEDLVQLQEQYDEQLHIFDKDAYSSGIYNKLIDKGYEALSDSEKKQIEDTELFKTIYALQTWNTRKVPLVHYYSVDEETGKPIGNKKTIRTDDILILDKLAKETLEENFIRIACAFEILS